MKILSFYELASQSPMSNKNLEPSEPSKQHEESSHIIESWASESKMSTEKPNSPEKQSIQKVVWKDSPDKLSTLKSSQSDWDIKVSKKKNSFCKRNSVKRKNNKYFINAEEMYK